MLILLEFGEIRLCGQEDFLTLNDRALSLIESQPRYIAFGIPMEIRLDEFLFAPFLFRLEGGHWVQGNTLAVVCQGGVRLAFNSITFGSRSGI